MTTLVFRFPGRRYHATPWGHHVNEGIIEWPPSPWRLLRALISVGYSACHWNGNGPPNLARALFEKLASVNPKFRLPNAVGAHSRHFMPIGELDKGRARTTLVFDTWAQIDRGEIVVTWDVELQSDERELLSELASKLGYLGRSESWVIAKFVDDDEIGAGDFDCFPCDDAPPIGWEQVPVLAPLSREIYDSWKNAAIEQATSALSDTDKNGKPLPKKQLANARQKLIQPYPEGLLECLQCDPAWLQRYGWSQPPGSRRVFYWRRSDALEVSEPSPRKHALKSRSVEAMLLALASRSGNDHALPHVTRTVPQAERLHDQLVRAASSQNSCGHSVVLTGCDESGNPLKGAHEHAHVLPLDLDEDGHLDHILVWAKMGLDAMAQDAVRAVRKTYTKGGIGALRLALAGSGSLHHFRRISGKYGDGLRAVLGPPNGSKAWISVTPFVPPRFLKQKGSNALAGQIASELESRGLPKAIDIKLICAAEDDLARRQRHFIRARKNGPRPQMDCGFTLKLQFDQPILGPLSIGYGSHFGLGLFAAIT